MKKIVLISFIINFIIADYASDIQPIFDSNCTSCHGYPNQYGDLILFSYDDLMNGGESGDVVIPYDGAESLLWQYIDSGYMPPYGSGFAPLTVEQISLIEDWINDGANETDSVAGCTDPNAITCDDEIDTLYFPECSTCSEGVSCENYYNPNATTDNDSCMYNDVPTDEEFSITNSGSNIVVDWSSFTPPVDDVLQYVIQRCLDVDGDSNGDGEYEYELCVMIVAPNSFYLETSVIDDYVLDDEHLKYTFYVHYPNNNYWGSAFGFYYYESGCTPGDLNGDSQTNVQDIVALVNAIFNPSSLSDTCAADLNQDGTLNVQDIVSLVSIILSI